MASNGILLAVLGLVAIAAVMWNSGDFGSVNENGGKNGYSDHKGKSDDTSDSNGLASNHGTHVDDSGSLNDYDNEHGVTVQITSPKEGQKMIDVLDRLWVKWRADDPRKLVKKFRSLVRLDNMLGAGENIRNDVIRDESCKPPCTTEIFTIDSKYDHGYTYTLVVFAVGPGDKVLAESEPVHVSFYNFSRDGNSGGILKKPEHGIALKITSPSFFSRERPQFEIKWTVDDPQNRIKRFAVIVAPASQLIGEKRVEDVKPLSYCSAPCTSQMYDTPKDCDINGYLTLVRALGHRDEQLAESRPKSFEIRSSAGKGSVVGKGLSKAIFGPFGKFLGL